jgi:hypothetical protein
MELISGIWPSKTRVPPPRKPQTPVVKSYYGRDPEVLSESRSLRFPGRDGHRRHTEDGVKLRRVLLPAYMDGF